MNQSIDLTMPEPKADINLAITVRDEDTDHHVDQKLHIYGSTREVVLKSVMQSAVQLIDKLGICNDGEERS